MNTQKTKGKPPRILIYGPQKIGKSSFGALADRPVFIQTEDGLDAINVDAFPLTTLTDNGGLGFKGVMANLESLLKDEHDFGTVVIDSLDWFEPMVWEQACRETGKAHIEEIGGGYGKGFSYALDLWREYITALEKLREDRGMTIIQIAHAQIRKFENPETDIYDRYEIKLHKSAGSLMMEHSDIILFANYYVGVKKEEKTMSKEGRKRAVGTGERVLYTEERPAFMAGNRYSLPAEIPFDANGEYWFTIANKIPYFNNEKGDVKHG
jgi:hypothetical protein